MNEKDKVWFNLSGKVTPAMEEEMLKKYRSKKAALVHWWGKSSRPGDSDYWELCVAKAWAKADRIWSTGDTRE